MKLSDIMIFNEANVQRIIANHTAGEAAKIIIEKWGNQTESMKVPSEEEIEKEANYRFTSGHGTSDDYSIVVFRAGAKWLRSQVKTINLPTKAEIESQSQGREDFISGVNWIINKLK